MHALPVWTRVDPAKDVLGLTASLRQSDSSVCLMEAIQQIYICRSDIKNFLPNRPWKFSGGDARNEGYLTMSMSNDDNKGHKLTWEFMVEALSAIRPWQSV
ncbi:MAG: hypothetical protein Q9169_004010 [Polycauliona sp. 2 TL-2023]